MTKKSSNAKVPSHGKAHELPALPEIAPAAGTHDAAAGHASHAHHPHAAHAPHDAPKEAPPAATQPSPAQAGSRKPGAIARLRSLFSRKAKAQAPEGKAEGEKKAPPSDDPEAQAEALLLRGRRSGASKRPRMKLKRKSLQEYLDKAGYDVPAERVKRTMFRTVLALFLLASAIVIFLGAKWGADALDTLLFLAGLWTAVFVLVSLLVLGTVYFFLDYRIYRRTRELEDVLPDFLQLASANIAAGMPIDRALWYSIRPSFGVLAKEMEEVAKATMSGEDLETSLVKFTQRYESVLLKRSISILIEGLRSGGELADLLNKIALNIDEIKIMKKEMAANVTTYAIFIIAAAVAIAPALFALATQLLSIIVKITGSLDLSSTSSMFALGPAVVGHFTVFCYVMLVVSSAFGASIVSVIRNGNVLEGIKSIPLYALVAIVIYKVSALALGVVFGSLL